MWYPDALHPDECVLVRYRMVESLPLFYVKYEKGYFAFKSVLRQFSVKNYVIEFEGLEINSIKTIQNQGVLAVFVPPYIWTLQQKWVLRRTRAQTAGMFVQGHFVT